MLQVRDLTKSYGATTILAGITFILNDSEHVGLIGPNGVGKTTLLRCILGLEQLDTGVIVRAPTKLVIGYLSQALNLPDNITIGDYLAAAQAEYVAAEQALQQAAEALAHTSDHDVALAAYDAALAHFEALGGYEREYRADEVMQGLELASIPTERLVISLSGGQQTRLGLAGLLLTEPDLLLLDEPTNHLDVEALEWLEGFVRSYPHSVLVVSHDRRFLDATVTRILYLDPDTRTVKSYVGDYSDFAEAREHEQVLHAEAWQKQQDYVGKVEADIARLKGQALSVELSTTAAQPNVRRLAKKVAKKAKSRERKLERYMESDERVERPRQSWGLKLDFGAAPEGGRMALRVEHVSFAWSSLDDTGMTQDMAAQNMALQDVVPLRSAPQDIAALLEDVNFEVAYGERVALVGPNGSGKTTLLKLIAGELQPQTGRIRLGSNVRMGLLAQQHETLDEKRSVLETVLRSRAMSETEARSFLHFFLFAGDSVFRLVGDCSLGERSRLQLALLVLGGCNMLLLDEPLNHLDIDGREHFEQALEAFEGTIIVVSHDRAFLDSFAERRLMVRGGSVTEL